MRSFDSDLALCTAVAASVRNATAIVASNHVCETEGPQKEDSPFFFCVPLRSHNSRHTAEAEPRFMTGLTAMPQAYGAIGSPPAGVYTAICVCCVERAAVSVSCAARHFRMLG